MKNRVRIIKKEFKVNACDVAMDIETWHLKKLLP